MTVSKLQYSHLARTTRYLLADWIYLTESLRWTHSREIKKEKEKEKRGR